MAHYSIDHQRPRHYLRLDTHSMFGASKAPVSLSRVADSGGRLSQGGVLRLGFWIANGSSQAENFWWLTVVESPPNLKIASGGTKMLDATLGSCKMFRSAPRWFSGSTECVSEERYSVLTAQFHETLKVLKWRKFPAIGTLTIYNVCRVDRVREYRRASKEGEAFANGST